MLKTNEETQEETQGVVGRSAERFARAVDRREVLKRGLIFATTVTLLDKVATARAGDPPPTAPDGTPLTFPDITASPNCCCCSEACYNVSDGNGHTCGCELGCCYQPAHSGTACQKRFTRWSYPSYCWTCFIGSTKYVCCDYYCYGQYCICSRNCANQGNCGAC